MTKPPKADILLVDDREDNLLGLEAILQDLDQNLIRARSGQEALRMLYDRDFAVILLDVRMPKMDGFETARWIRKRERSRFTPIIFVTAVDAEPEDIARGYAVGAVDFLFKPFQPEVLKAKVVIFLELFQKTAELRASEARFRTFVENLPGVAYRAANDFPRTFRLLSDPVRDITGHPPADFFEGRISYDALVHPEDLEPFRKAVRDAVRNHGVYALDYRVVHEGGQVHWVFDKGRPSADDPGSVDGVLFDITDRKLAEEALRRRTVELEAVNRELDSFCYTVSHDLRAPLRAMAGYSEAIGEDFGDRLDDTGRQYLSRIAASAKRMDVLIQDLLAYSRLSRSDFDLQALDVEKVLGEAMRHLAGEIEAAKANVTVADGFPTVIGHPLTLQMALANLLSNAIKFVPPGRRPEVRVRSETSGGTVRLWVEDNGIGIPEQYHDRIFGVFQRLNSPAAYAGTGIGLAIVRRAAERMGGRAGVESNPGLGSRFWIDLSAGETCPRPGPDGSTR